MRTRLGVDEAGRGCVLGPLVFGACLVPDEGGEAALRALGVADSKALSPRRREELRAALDAARGRGDVLDLRVELLQPAEIDDRSLGELGKRAIVTLAAAARPDVLVLDAPVPPAGIPGWVADLRRRLVAAGLPAGIGIVAENRADATQPCCSAASILAKTTRDALLAGIERAAGEALGSGYPSDPATQAWLRHAWERDRRFPDFVRTKWATVRRIVAADAQGRLPW